MLPAAVSSLRDLDNTYAFSCPCSGFDTHRAARPGRRRRLPPKPPASGVSKLLLHLLNVHMTIGISIFSSVRFDFFGNGAFCLSSRMRPVRPSVPRLLGGPRVRPASASRQHLAVSVSCPRVPVPPGLGPVPLFSGPAVPFLCVVLSLTSPAPWSLTFGFCPSGCRLLFLILGVGTLVCILHLAQTTPPPGSHTSRYVRHSLSFVSSVSFFKK